jgi:hypothetical protein
MVGFLGSLKLTVIGCDLTLLFRMQTGNVQADLGADVMVLP